MAKKPKRKPYLIKNFLLVVFTALAAAMIYLVWIAEPTQNVVSKLKTASGIENAPFPDLMPALEKFGMDSTSIKKFGDSVAIAVPEKYHPAVLYHQVSQKILELGGEITQGKQVANDGTSELHYKLDEDKKGVIRISPVATDQNAPKIAIVIDDFGYRMDSIVKTMLNFESEITYAIIPGLPYSKAVADSLKSKQKNFLIHLPMEPMAGPVEDGPYTIFTKLKPEAIRTRVHAARAFLPDAVGLNNHMGSKATSDSSVMAHVLDAVQQNGLLFLDSHTSAKTVGYKMARQRGIRTLMNNVFIDAVDDPVEIEAKMERLFLMAREDGLAIGIGHPREHTLRVLQKFLPQFEEKGVQFIDVLAAEKYRQSEKMISGYAKK